MLFQIMAPTAAPRIGAAQNSQSWFSAAVSAKIAAPVDRAGLTDVLVTGMETRWISVRVSPIASGAKPALAFLAVVAKMTKTKKAVITVSMAAAAGRAYPAGESSPKPFAAKRPAIKSGLPEPMK